LTTAYAVYQAKPMHLYQQKASTVLIFHDMQQDLVQQQQVIMI
jgi:hypothetical protein